MKALLNGYKYLVVAALVVVMAMSAFAQPTEQTFTILGAYGNVGDVDPYTDCSSDGGVTWHEAYLTGWHPWGFAPGTNSWVSIDPNNAVGINGEHDFRIRFLVPADFSDPSMVFVIKADNAADVWVNDTYITHVTGTFTYEAGDAVIAEALVPGVNEIRIHLIDWGGIVGINYRIDATMTSAEDISNPVLTPDEADELEGPTEVTIDIKPGSDVNPVNPKSRGVIPVAILTDENFDATTVDVSSLRFGPGEASAAHNGHIEDVDDDGDMDLMLHFRTQDSGVSNSDTELTLTGMADGQEIFGTDVINVRPKNGGHSASTGTEAVIMPTEVALDQNYPNPFNPTTSISYSLPEAGTVKLVVYDIRGSVVAELANGQRPAGNHHIEFDASHLASGTYFYSLDANGVHQVRKMLLIK